MGFFVENLLFSVRLSLNTLRCVGFWPPDELDASTKVMFDSLKIFWFMYMLGIYIIIQTVDLALIWGNLSLMTRIAFVLFTNLAVMVKLINLMMKKKAIQEIISECEEVLLEQNTDEEKNIVKELGRELKFFHVFFIGLTTVTAIGWASSAEKDQLPVRAWYPYDTHRSPAYELTYIHQMSAIFISAYVNVGMDTLVSGLIAQCRCRLKLLGFKLRTVCDDVDNDKQWQLSQSATVTVQARIRACAVEHQRVLNTVMRVQSCFTIPTFTQFFVSLIIICATAFHLVSQTGNLVGLLSTGCYLMNMMYQVFLYCYQGTQLTEESIDLASNAYQSPWYKFPVRLRRSLLIIMTRTRLPARLVAGGFTPMSLASFMAIIKTSYSLFTLLKQVDEKK